MLNTSKNAVDLLSNLSGGPNPAGSVENSKNNTQTLEQLKESIMKAKMNLTAEEENIRVSIESFEKHMS